MSPKIEFNVTEWLRKNQNLTGAFWGRKPFSGWGLTPPGLKPFRPHCDAMKSKVNSFVMALNHLPLTITYSHPLVEGGGGGNNWQLVSQEKLSA